MPGEQFGMVCPGCGYAAEVVQFFTMTSETVTVSCAACRRLSLASRDVDRSRADAASTDDWLVCEYCRGRAAQWPEGGWDPDVPQGPCPECGTDMDVDPEQPIALLD